MKGLKFGDRQNEIDHLISIGVVYEPCNDPVTGDPSEVVQLDIQIDKEDADKADLAAEDTENVNENDTNDGETDKDIDSSKRADIDQDDKSQGDVQDDPDTSSVAVENRANEFDLPGTGST